jgi:hypothetical protein
VASSVRWSGRGIARRGQPPCAHRFASRSRPTRCSPRSRGAGERHPVPRRRDGRRRRGDDPHHLRLQGDAHSRPGGPRDRPTLRRAARPRRPTRASAAAIWRSPSPDTTTRRPSSGCQRTRGGRCTSARGTTARRTPADRFRRDLPRGLPRRRRVDGRPPPPCSQSERGRRPRPVLPFLDSALFDSGHVCDPTVLHRGAIAAGGTTVHVGNVIHRYLARRRRVRTQRAHSDRARALDRRRRPAPLGPEPGRSPSR